MNKQTHRNTSQSYRKTWNKRSSIGAAEKHHVFGSKGVKLVTCVLITVKDTVMFSMCIWRTNRPDPCIVSMGVSIAVEALIQLKQAEVCLKLISNQALQLLHEAQSVVRQTRSKCSRLRQIPETVRVD